MDITSTKTTINYTMDQLMQEHSEHVQLIERIKQNVAQEYDNINKPVEFSSQLANRDR